VKERARERAGGREREGGEGGERSFLTFLVRINLSK